MKSYKDAVSKGSDAPPSSTADSPLTCEQEAALRQHFPTRVQLSREKVASATAYWSNAVIAKPLGRDVAPEKMEAALTPQWSTLGEWELFPMAYGLFICRFASPESRDAVMIGGPWVVDGAALAMSPFVPDFRPHPSHVTTAVIWVRLPDLPPAVWSADLICDLLSIVGRVVRLDDDTERRRRGRFARAAVEVDLTRPLPPGVAVDVEGGSLPPFWQRFRYEHLHSCCLRCRRVGHRAAACTEPPSSSPIIDESFLVRRPPFSRPKNHPPLRPSSLRRTGPPRGDDPDSPAHGPPRGADPDSPAHGPASHGSSRAASPTHGHESHGSSRAASLGGFPPPRGDNPASSFGAKGPTQAGQHDVTVKDVTAQPSPSAASHGPKTGPMGFSGFSSPQNNFTSAAGPKQDEPECSHPPSSVQPEQPPEGLGDGVYAVGEVTERERRLIQQIMEEDLESNSDFLDEADLIEDDVLFTTVGKKKKSKGKFPAICLRPAPRDRASMKRTKAAPSSSAGKFSLLADLLGGMPPGEIVARHGPPEG